MRRGFLISILFLFPYFGYTQLDCDSLECAKYADTSSFVILGLAEQTETSTPNTNYMISCKMLCEIEAARSNFADVTVNIRNYSVLIYKREEQEMVKEK